MSYPGVQWFKEMLTRFGVLTGSTLGDVYVDRGDPAAADFTALSFTCDGTWRDLDLSAICPAASANHLVHLRLEMIDNVTGTYFYFRENGNANTFNIAGGRLQVANIYTGYTDMWIMMDANRVIEYTVANGTTFVDVHVIVRGWYVDAT